MYIQNLNKTYTVVKHIVENSHISSYLCTEEFSPNKLFIVNTIKNKSIIVKHLSNISEASMENVQDFFESFTFNSKYNMVFNYTTENPLTDYVTSNSLSEKERILLTIKIISLVLLEESIPSVIKRIMLIPENINVENISNISFNYIFYSPDILNDDSSFIKEQKDVANLLKLVFKDLPGYNIIIEKCTKGVYSSVYEIITDLKSVENALSSTSELKHQRKQKLKVFMSKAKKVSLAAILCIVVIYVLYNFFNKSPVNEGTEVAPVTNIGDVELPEESNVIIDEKDSTSNNNEIINTTLKITHPTVVEPNPEPVKSIDEAEELKDTKYVVKPNDDLSKICEYFYHDSSYYYRLGIYNNIKDFNIIRLGTELIIPEKSILDNMFNE